MKTLRKNHIKKNKTRKTNITSRKWSDVLHQWSQGDGPVYPSDMKKRFFFETSVLSRDKNSIYQEVFIKTKDLDSLICDPSSFQEHINKAQQQQNGKKVAVAFPNLSGDSLLLVPLPKEGSKGPCKYTTIKDFIDNAPPEQQKGFWKFSAREIKKRLKKREKIYISTHGTGIPYFHLRLDDIPKYYQTKRFK